VARFYDRAPGFSRWQEGQKADTTAPVHLLPEGMSEVQVNYFPAPLSVFGQLCAGQC